MTFFVTAIHFYLNYPTSNDDGKLDALRRRGCQRATSPTTTRHTREHPKSQSEGEPRCFEIQNGAIALSPTPLGEHPLPAGLALPLVADTGHGR